MQILYVLAAIAVFVLCIALLSTARKILRSSSSSSSHLGLACIQGPQLSDDDFSDRDTQDWPAPANVPVVRMEAGYATPAPTLDETFFENELPAAAHPAVAEPVVVQAQAAAFLSLPTALEFPGVRAAFPQEPEVAPAPGKAKTSKWARFPKPSRRAYNYAIECALLGVSAWVLIRTQRSMERNRMLLASQNRVA